MKLCFFISSLLTSVAAMLYLSSYAQALILSWRLKFVLRDSIIKSQIVYGGTAETIEAGQLPVENYVMLIHAEGLVCTSKCITT